jgi:hypothetical protein
MILLVQGGRLLACIQWVNLFEIVECHVEFSQNEKEIQNDKLNTTLILLAEFPGVSCRFNIQYNTNKKVSVI